MRLDTNFVPKTEMLSNLNLNFTESKKLKLSEYWMTRDNTKYIIVTIRPLSASMITTYELRRNITRQRLSENEDYGCVDLSLCINGDDRENYLVNYSVLFLLHWWHKLDVEGFAQFTICILNKFQRSNAVDF